MPRTITISLPVADIEASKKFYAAVGFVANAQFAGGDAALFVWSDTISVMLVTRKLWGTFTARPIAPKGSNEVGLNLTVESRAIVDAMNKAAGENGGTSDINPIEDTKEMYGRDFADPDGHIWGPKWMDGSLCG